MSAYSGPAIVDDGLVFSYDAASPLCINASGCVGYNNAPQLIKNLISPLDVISSSSTLRLGNLSYYTAFSIDYPESSFGGDAVSRQGITPGFNVRSGSKTYDASRSLHLWVWNNETSTWVPDSFFRGESLAGHCYDSYVGTAPVDLWVADYNIIKNTFKDITVIASGSHRDSFHTAAQYEILRDLGAPSNVDSIIGFSSPEWILVGKPGLGAGNGAWAFQNYSTNPDQVAHLNFGIPFKGGPNNYLEFNGSSDYIQTSITGSFPQISFDFWSFFDDPALNMYSREESILGDWNNERIHFGTRWGGAGMHWNVNSIWQETPNTNLRYGWNHYSLVWNHDTSEKKVYINSILSSSSTTNGNIVLGDFKIGVATALGYYYRGKIGKFSIYNRSLTADEVQQNFNAHRSRYGL
jgi:hypothetical protein